VCSRAFSGRNRSMRKHIRRLALVALLAAGYTTLLFSAAAEQDSPPIPSQLQPPANEQILVRVHAKGDQIYTCKGDAAQFTWVLKAPEAQLFDKDGKPFGKHFAGPSWEANDGSRVTGKAIANAPAPDSES